MRKSLVITAISATLAISAFSAEISEFQCSGDPQDLTIKQSIKWYRDSAEKKAIYREVFFTGVKHIENKVKNENLKQGTWGVSIDIDETALDNSLYYKNCSELADSNEDKFSKFVAIPEFSVALPGIRNLANKVHKLGGYVTLISNRDGSYKDETGNVMRSTINNLKKEKIYFDQILMANRKESKQPSDKNPRFEAVETGKYDSAQMTWSNKLPPYKIIAYFGDNIQDFPKFKQNDMISKDGEDSTFDKFGDGYFILPNPMYGSWTSNEYK